TIHMTIFLDFVAPTVKAFFLFITFDFVKVTMKSRFCVGSTINFVHYVVLSEQDNPEYILCRDFLQNLPLCDVIVSALLSITSIGQKKRKA
ncbi:MAG: hypothetical protein K6E93_02350, partial [Bacteroidales bacterium]|nr:hypothetical protein [Bacteroidales bacterium]